MATAEDSGTKPRRQCDITRHENYLKRKARVCEQCGEGFTEGALSAKQIAGGHIQRFCSRACSSAARRRYADKREAKRAEHSRARARAGLPPAFQPQVRQCVSCASDYIARTAVMIRCEGCRDGRRKRITSRCEDCGTEIVGTASKRLCKSCRVKRSRMAATIAHGSTKKHRHRARKFGVAYEPISPIKLFDRDGWRCQICGASTPKRLRGTYDDRAPEVDHRIPMAMGGPHTWSNVQTACRACNIRKGGAKIEGQMRLFA